MSLLTALSLTELSALQEAWSNVILQASFFPAATADITMAELLAELYEIDSLSFKDGPEGQVARAKSAYLFSYVRDLDHMSHSGRQILLVGLNGRSRAIYDLAVASDIIGTGD